MTPSMTTRLAALAVVLTVTVPAAAQAPPKSADTAKPGMVLADVVKLTATVEGIDQGNRTVTLKSAGGRSTTLKVDKAVKNFDQVRVGDKLAAVENINYDQRLVTLRGPAGHARTLKVDPRVERLREVKIGDELVIRHTEALAIAVMKPAS